MMRHTSGRAAGDVFTQGRQQPGQMLALTLSCDREFQ